MTDDLLKGLHIAVTRPVDQALNLGEMIEYHGGKAIPFPLITIVPLEDYRAFEQTIAGLEQVDWAIFISTNAVDHALPKILQKIGYIPERLKFAAIGQQTAKQLACYGVHQALAPQTRFDSESLLALAEMYEVADKTIVIFRGLGGRDILAETLKARGAKIIFAECYRRTNPQTDTALLSRLWQLGQLDAVIVTSSEAMRNLINLARESAWLQEVTLCVNHARIAEQPLQLGLKVLVADAPGDDAMIKCLSQLNNRALFRALL